MPGCDKGRSRLMSADHRTMLLSGIAKSSLPAGESCFHLHLDRTAGVVEVEADFLADGLANLLGQRSQRLASGSGAAFKGAVEGIERR
jgi:hypothetical protein